MKHRLFISYFLFIVSCSLVHAQEEITLEQVVALALEKNFDVQIMRQQAKAADTDRDLSWGAFLPQVNATGSRSWNDNFQSLRVGELL